MADKEATMKRAEKRMRKAVDDYSVPEAVKEIGEALQMAAGEVGAEEAVLVASADLPGGDVATAVFSIVGKDEVEAADDAERGSDGAGCADGSDRQPALAGCLTVPSGCLSWLKCAKEIDRFRDLVSANFGFKRDLVKPIAVRNSNHPLRLCMFECMGVTYKVCRRQISVAGDGDA